MMVRTIKLDIQNRKYKSKLHYGKKIDTLHHSIKTENGVRNKKVQQNTQDENKFDKDFEEGLKDLFETYDTTLKNLVNR